jgi:thiol-disulfide isomerase/thioredoxin
VVVLNLWATWCAPCKIEMPTLAKLQAAYAASR